MRNKIIFACLAVILALGVLINSSSLDIYAYDYKDDINAKSFVVVDNNGKILLSNNCDEKREVASICKLMTTLITLENIEDGKLTLDDKILASSHACDAEGSQAFLDAGSKYSVRDLLKSVIVASANDSAIVLAEAIGGSEPAFVELMNARAEELGMKNTKYANATGLPASEQFSTALDTALLLKEVSQYPIYREDCKIWLDSLTHPSGRETELVNTNRLIKYYPYCKTGKTGFTDEAGYCLSSTADKDDFRLTCVVLGCDSSANRFSDSVSLYNYAYANFDSKKIISDGEMVDNNIKIVAGKNSTIDLELADDFYLTTEKGEDNNYSIKYELPEKLKAPLYAGDCVGRALVISQGEIIEEVDIIVSRDVLKHDYRDVLNKVVSDFGLIK